MNRLEAYQLAQSVADETGLSPLFFSIYPSSDGPDRWSDCIIRFSEPKTGRKSTARDRGALLAIVRAHFATRAK